MFPPFLFVSLGMEIKVSKTNKYLTIFHNGGIWFDFSEGRKRSNENVILNSSGRSGDYVHIKVEGNEQLVDSLKSQLAELKQMDVKNNSKYSKLQELINKLYLDLFNYKPYKR